MRRPRAQCPKSQGIKGHVERDEAVLRYVDRGPSIDRRRRQRRQRVEEEGSSTLGVLRLPGGEMVLVETEPHPETLESLFAEPVFQPVEDVGLGFGRRSEERRVGKECDSTVRFRGWRED